MIIDNMKTIRRNKKKAKIVEKILNNFIDNLPAEFIHNMIIYGSSTDEQIKNEIKRQNPGIKL